MTLLTEQEIRDIARSVKEIGENSDRALILAAQKAVIEKIKAQGPVAEFGGLRITPEGTNEFWGWTIGDSADVLVSGMKLYRLPEGD